MLAMVPEQRATFRNDEFISQMTQFSNVRFTPFEHAPMDERRQHFREALEQRRVALTFIETGINLTLELSTSIFTCSSKIDLESEPFIFNGVMVRAIGYLCPNDLRGKLKFELNETAWNQDVGPEWLTADQLMHLRGMGLP